MAIIRCKHCESLFKVRKPRVWKKNGEIREVKFCSRECSSLNHKGSKLEKRAKEITYKCPNCLNNFSMNESQFRFQKIKCCSIKCAAEYKKNRFAVKRGNCESCGKKLESEQRRFCSMMCMRKRKIVVCEKCEIKFESRISDDDRRFCSNACYKSSNNETGIERKIRKYLEKQGVFFKTQVAFERYVVDFLLPDHGLVIEADGEYWHSKESVKKRDRIRDKKLIALGFDVVRLKEKDINSGEFIKNITEILSVQTGKTIF